MTKPQAEIIMGLAANGLNISRTAKATYRHRNTVCAHIRNIKESTGKNPTDFYDMIELEKEARQVLGYEAKQEETT